MAIPSRIVSVLLGLVMAVSGAEDPSALNAEPELSARETFLIRRVERYLRADPDLLAGHRAYLRFLEGETPEADAETTYAETLQAPHLRHLVARFDELLQSNPDLEQTFDRLFDHLEEDPEAGRMLDGILQWQAAYGQPSRPLSDSINAFMADPERAAAFLRAPSADALQTMPELGAFQQLLQDRPEAGMELFEMLRTGIERPGDRTAIEQWAMTIEGLEGEDGRDAFGALENHLLQRSGRFWTWQQRQRALAADPERREWIRDWHRQIRRNAILYRDYWAYVGLLQRHPRLRREREAQWNEYDGDDRETQNSDFPPIRPRIELPSVSPPSRPEAARSRDTDGLNRPEPPSRPERPQRPSVRRPVPPDRTRGPIRPEQ